MPHESFQAELARLLKEQDKTRQDEVFGGLSSAERAEYDGKTRRINQLAIELTASAVAKKSSQSVKAEQRRQWSKKSETDTPQVEAHQPYRSREKDSTDNFTDSRRHRRKVKQVPKEEGGE
jgi:hypothetical protein